MIDLTKTLEPGDLTAEELLAWFSTVNRHFSSSSGQHEQRRWEYAMALHAIERWKQELPLLDEPLRVADVGGAGSPFSQMVEASGGDCTVIDEGGPELYPTKVEAFAAQLVHPTFNVVTSISVFEHTTRPLAFLDALIEILEPGGLLFMTFDYAGERRSPEDTCHFNWMRERIVTRAMWDALLETLHLVGGLEPFGEVDLRYHGPQVYDYTFASLCMRKPA